MRECTLLAKALRDPPDLFHGISDVETRYRQRELDLMANERSREVFMLRAKVLAAIRDHMNEHGYVELETPILQRLTGGAAARPFKTHHHALDRHLFLRIATELYLKRVDRRRLRGRLRAAASSSATRGCRRSTTPSSRCSSGSSAAPTTTA